MHYFKLNIGDYAKKAGRLSMLQHGSYTLLMQSCYDREQFPTLEEAIEWTWASTTEEIEAVTFVLRKFFVLEDGVYVQKRIQEEIADYHAKSEQNKQIAIDRETKRKTNSTKRAQDVDGSAGSDNEPPPNHKPLTTNHKPLTNTKDKAAAPAIVLPDWIQVETWAAFMETRKKKKATNTEFAVNLILKDLTKYHAAGHDVDDILSKSIKGGWSDVYEPKTDAQKKTSGSQKVYHSLENMNYAEGVTEDGSF